MKKIFTTCLLMAAFTYVTQAQTKIAAKDAAKHIGDSVLVMAKVFGGKSFASNMVLLDVEGFNPNQLLTLMIPADDRAKFKTDPVEDYKGKEVTITGKIIEYKGKPEIIIHDPKQIKLLFIDNSKTPALPIRQ